MPGARDFSRQTINSKFYRLNELESDRIGHGVNFPNDSEWSLSSGLDPENSRRNRYSNVLPWNKNRVPLPTDSGKSDYINASYIYIGDEKKYIATQGPLKRTIRHFWEMCFNEAETNHNDEIIIVMVTPLVEGGMKKCEKYWPDEGTKMVFADETTNNTNDTDIMTLTFVSSNTNEVHDFIVTEFLLEYRNVSKQVYHYYYYNWADAKVPPSSKSLIALSKSLNGHVLSGADNNCLVPVIHCSAGVGRTGTFIVLDQLLHNKNIKSHEDPIEHLVSELRDCRMMMVQTVHQFNYLYEVSSMLQKETK